MSDLLWGMLTTATLLESTALGSKTATAQGPLLLGQGLTFTPATPFATYTAGSKLGAGSRLAFVGLATRIVHARSVISDGLAMLLLAVVAAAAQGAHTTDAFMIC